MGAVLTPKERIERFFNKEPIDAMPVFSGMGMLTVQALRKMGARFTSLHNSAGKLVDSAVTSASIFGFDGVVIPYDMCVEAEALGLKPSFYPDSDDILFPTVPYKWSTFEEVKIPEKILTHGRIPMITEALGALVHNSEQAGCYAVGGWVLGPFTLAGQVLENRTLFKSTMKQKEALAALLDRMTDVVIEIACHWQSLGVDYITIREMGTGMTLLSPTIWKSFIQPCLRRIFSALRLPKVLHICGSTGLIISMMNDCGADAVSVDQMNDVAESRRILGKDALILGNFDPRILVASQPEEVEGVIRKCIEDGVDAVWPGCDFWPDVKEANVRRYVQTIRKYGGMPSPAVGRMPR